VTTGESLKFNQPRWRFDQGYQERCDQFDLAPVILSEFDFAAVRISPV
jgi:hypothetical protein